MRCDRTVDSGAYVLGALAPAERAEYEQHLVRCPACRAEVADLAVLPGLLGRLDVASAERIAATGSPGPDTAGPRLLSRVMDAAGAAQRRRAKRRVWMSTAVAVAAACVVLVAVIGLVNGGGPAPTRAPQAAASLSTPKPTAPTLTTMQPVGAWQPISAEVGLTALGAGTQVLVHCWYNNQTDQYDDTWTFRLYVYPRGGQREEISSWNAGPGDDLRMSGTTHVARTDIVKVEVDNDKGQPLLTYVP